MSDLAPAVHWADRAVHVRAAVAANDPLGRDTFRLRLIAPQIARRIVPGQFVMLRLTDSDDPLLARPLALYDTSVGPSGEPDGLDVVYLVVGKMTRRLARLSLGQETSVWGPLGNGFPPDPAEHLIMVAGGIGQTPFLAMAREFLGKRQYGDPPRSAPQVGRVTLCYGVRSAAYLAGVEDFQRLGVEVLIATDDGTAGRRGLVTQLLDPFDAQAGRRIVCCGPEAMMRAVAKIAAARKISCQVSLESPMACGIGICFSCVAKVREPAGGWDYRRTCVEGPVFDAERIEW